MGQWKLCVQRHCLSPCWRPTRAESQLSRLPSGWGCCWKQGTGLGGVQSGPARNQADDHLCAESSFSLCSFISLQGFLFEEAPVTSTLRRTPEVQHEERGERASSWHPNGKRQPHNVPSALCQAPGVRTAWCCGIPLIDSTVVANPVSTVLMSGHGMKGSFCLERTGDSKAPSPALSLHAAFECRGGVTTRHCVQRKRFPWLFSLKPNSFRFSWKKKQGLEITGIDLDFFFLDYCYYYFKQQSCVPHQPCSCTYQLKVVAVV